MRRFERAAVVGAVTAEADMEPEVRARHFFSSSPAPRRCCSCCLDHTAAPQELHQVALVVGGHASVNAAAVEAGEQDVAVRGVGSHQPVRCNGVTCGGYIVYGPRGPSEALSPLDAAGIMGGDYRVSQTEGSAAMGRERGNGGYMWGYMWGLQTGTEGGIGDREKGQGRSYGSECRARCRAAHRQILTPIHTLWSPILTC